MEVRWVGSLYFYSINEIIKVCVIVPFCNGKIFVYFYIKKKIWRKFWFYLKDRKHLSNPTGEVWHRYLCFDCFQELLSPRTTVVVARQWWIEAWTWYQMIWELTLFFLELRFPNIGKFMFSNLQQSKGLL